VEAFLARYRNVTVLALALFAQLLLLGYQVKGDKDVRLIRVWAVTSITPVARLLHSGHQFVTGFWGRYVWLYGAGRQNEQLRGELDRLRLENQSLRNAVGAASRLEILASYRQSIASQTLIAEVIGTGANPNSRVVFLDKGSGAGVKPGMAVITAVGIVGKVQAVFPGSSLVLLISDMHSGVGVLLESSRVHGVLKGTGLNQAKIDYVPSEEKVSVGEKVYTSGEDRVYPKGLLVGTVAAVQPGKDFQEITLRPGASLNRLEEVLVVIAGVHEELPETLPRPQAPTEILAAPPREPGKDLLGTAPQAPAVSSGAEPYMPQTDADKLKKRYQDLGRAQGHSFGEGLPGSKPPDFNLGLNVPAGRPAGATKPPAGEPSPPAATTSDPAVASPPAQAKTPPPAPVPPPEAPREDPPPQTRTPAPAPGPKNGQPAGERPASSTEQQQRPPAPRPPDR